MSEALGALWRRWEAWVASQAPRGADVKSAARLFVALAAVLAVALLGLGAQVVPVLAVASALAFATAVVALRGSSAKLEGPALVLFALGAWSVVQAIPLPLGLVKLLSPKAAEIWARVYTLTETSRSWASISLDPGASMVEALKWSAYGAVAVTASLVTRNLGPRVISALTLGLATLLAVVTLAHGIFHAHSVYGIYVPTFDPGPWGFGPILNQNNRAGYLNLGAFAGLSLLMSERLNGRWWWPVALGSGLLVAMSLLTNSRGGVLALGGMSVVLVVMLLRRAAHRDGWRRMLYLRAAIPPLLVLGGGVVLALLGADKELWQKMRHESMEKLHIVGWTRSLFADFPLFGVGRGAFETVFPAYRQTGDHKVYHHAENFVTDWATEWGLVVAVPALLALAWMVRPRKGEESARTGLRLALGVLLVQNLVDHAMEMPAVGLLAATIAAALGTRQTERPATPAVQRFRVPAVALAGAALTVGLVVFGWDTATYDRTELSERTRSVDPDRDLTQQKREVFAEIRAAMLRHPADPFLPLLAAMTARHLPEGKAVRWLGWSLERDMMSGHTHFAAAYFLNAFGATHQALDELRVAAERSSWIRPKVAIWAAAIAPNPDDALSVVPDGKEGAAMLVTLAGTPLFAPHRLALLEEVTARDPELASAHKAAALSYIVALGNHESSTCQWAERPACIDRVNKHVLALARLQPESSFATELAARLLAVNDRQNEARTLLSEKCSTFAESASCWQLRVTLARGEVSGPALREALQGYYTAACANSRACITAATWLGTELSSRGDSVGALDYYGRAVRSGDDSPKLWLAISRAARTAGQPRRANEALEHARRGAREDPALRDRIDKELRATVATAPLP